MESVSFEESIRRWSLTCTECGKPSDGGGGVVQLALGHMIHRQCYKAFLRQQEDAARKCGWRTLASVVRASANFGENRQLPSSRSLNCVSTDDGVCASSIT